MKPMMLAGLLGAAIASGTATAVQDPGRSGTAVEWIDVHMHLILGPSRDVAGATRVAVGAMDQAGIKAAVLMPPPQVGGMRGSHDVQELRDAAMPYRGRLSYLGGGGSLNPMLIEAAGKPVVNESTRTRFERTARDILAAGALGFGEITAHHLSHAAGHPYEWAPPDHPLLLLLADIAAERDVVIDLHVDVVPQTIDTPARWAGPPNPPRLQENLSALERLLAHNRRAKIVWAHAGSDPLGNRTPAQSREMLARHPNLYMSLRLPAGAQRPGMPPQFATDMSGAANPAWVDLVNQFPDRFVMGGDQFMPSPELRGEGPGLTFARMSAPQRDMARKFLLALPPDTRHKVAVENAVRLYKLKL